MVDLVGFWVWMPVQQALRCHDLTRGTESALKGIFLNEGFLDRVEVPFFLETFNRLDGLSIAVNRQRHT
jgi:hypothetical protein